MNYDESVRSLLTLGRELGAPRQARLEKFGLNNIAILSEGLGNPHRAVPCAHVAGTNGKGSTAAMLESILRAAGMHTGLYTSPHLERINERIRIDGEDIPDAEFAAIWTRVQASIEALMASGKLGGHPTFFECITAIAFVAFADRGVDFVVHEVGLGGRFDATNIVQPEVAVITPIDFDHENFLGHSIEEIAGEKAGIIKPGARVVSAVERPEARKVVARQCTAVGAKLVEIDDYWRVGRVHSKNGAYAATAYSNQPENSIEIAPSLLGRFQVRNALTAAAAARLLAQRGFPLTDESIVTGIVTARWPGRLERLSENPPVYLDGTHNPAGARELLKFWEENLKDRRILLVYGAMRDKAVDEIAGLLFPRAATVILTQPRQPRAVSASTLAEMTNHFAEHFLVVPDPVEALNRALQMASGNDAIFATGSLYLVGELRAHWDQHKLTPTSAISGQHPR